MLLSAICAPFHFGNFSCRASRSSDEPEPWHGGEVVRGQEELTGQARREWGWLVGFFRN